MERQSEKETKGAVFKRVPAHGGGANEKLRPRYGLSPRTGSGSADVVPLAGATGSGRSNSECGSQLRAESTPTNQAPATVVGGENPGSGFFQRCLAQSRGSTAEERQLWRDDIYELIVEWMSVQGSLSIERMCQLAQVPRSGLYRFVREQRPVDEEMEVRSMIQQIALEHRRRYGYRRITAELRRRGLYVNHKRVLRMMRNDNLLAVQPRPFVVTTQSKHRLEVYLNLAGRMKLTGINQLWVADITYIRLQREFVYLAVILDGFSRKVVCWALERKMTHAL